MFRLILETTFVNLCYFYLTVFLRHELKLINNLMILIKIFIFRVLFETILNYKEIMQLLQVFEIKVYHLTYRENNNFRQQF